VLDDDTRESPQHNFDPAQDVDAAARAVHVTHAHRDALHRLRVSGEQFSEPSPDVGAIVVVQSDTVNPDVRGRPRRRSAIDSSRFGRRHLVSASHPHRSCRRRKIIYPVGGFRKCWACRVFSVRDSGARRPAVARIVQRTLKWPVKRGPILAAIRDRASARSIVRSLTRWAAHHSFDEPAITMNRSAETHSTLREGLIAGALAATGVAVWFLIVDLVAADLFFTPVRLGNAFGRVFGVGPMVDSRIVALVGYTIVHYVGFAVIGIAAAAIVHASHRQPAILAGAFLAFIVAEVLIYGFIALLHATDLLAHLTWILIAVGNLIGAALIGWKLWRDHPGLRQDIDSALSGRA